MVKKVFYIEKEKFLRSMMELALKSKGAEIYTVESIADNFYLIDDLTPNLIIVDENTVTNEELDKILNYGIKCVSTRLPLNPESFKVQKVDLILEKPLVANSLATKILGLID